LVNLLITSRDRTPWSEAAPRTRTSPAAAQLGTRAVEKEERQAAQMCPWYILREPLGAQESRVFTEDRRIV